MEEKLQREFVDSPSGAIYVLRACDQLEPLRRWSEPPRLCKPILPDRPGDLFGTLRTERVVPTDRTDAQRGVPFRIIEVPGLNIEIARRNERLSNYHRNLRADEMVIANRGHTTYETELGLVELFPGEVLFHPTGMSHRNFPDLDNVQLFNIIIESESPLSFSKDALRIFEPATVGAVAQSEEETYEEWIDLGGRDFYMTRPERPSAVCNIDPVAGHAPLVHGKVNAELLVDSTEASRRWDGSVTVLEAPNGLRLDIAAGLWLTADAHRNIRADKIIVGHRGRVRCTSELGITDAGPGEFVIVPRGVSHRLEGVSDALYFILEYPAATVTWTEAAMPYFDGCGVENA